MGELFLVFGTLCRGQTRLPAILQKGLDLFQILLLPQWVRQLEGLKKKQINRYFTVASTCASLTLLQPSIMYRQLIPVLKPHPLTQISFGDFYQKTMNFQAGETGNIIMGNMLFPREDC